MRLHRRALLKAAGALTLASALPGLARAQQGGVLRFVPQADLATLDPVITSALVTRNHGFMVFDTLWGLDSSFAPRPQMVEGHVLSDDGRSWDITLRPGLAFHDGTPVLGGDAAASISRWMKIASTGKTLATFVDEIAATGDRSFRIRLKAPFPMLPYALGVTNGNCFIMPERLALTEPSVQVTEMVGSGPFRFVAAERNPGQLSVYERFAGYVPRAEAPSYTAGAKVAQVNRIEWHTMPDAATAAAALMAGEIDWWEQPQPDLIPLLQSDDRITVAIKDKAGFSAQMRFNHLLPPFDNPAMRRALLAGIRQSDYMMSVMGDDSSLWSDRAGVFPPDSPYASDAGMEVLTSERSLDKVRADLKAAGYDGERVVLLVPTDLPALNNMSQVFGDMLRRVGINLDYQTSDWGTVLPRLNSKAPLDQGGWNLWITYTSGVITANPLTSSLLRGNGEAGPLGWSTSPDLERLRDAFLAAPDEAGRKALGAEIQRQALIDLPHIPLGFYRQPTAFRSNVQDILEGFPIFWNLRLT